MAGKTYRLPPCPGYDVEWLESWLQDMAKEGLVLEPENEFFGAFRFTRTCPQTLRYRLQPKPEGDDSGIVPDAEARDTAAEFGWEFVDSYGSFYIYRTADPLAREMDTDLEVQAIALKNVKKGFWARIFSEFFSIFCISIILRDAGPVRFLVSLPPVYSLPWCCCRSVP